MTRPPWTVLPRLPQKKLSMVATGAVDLLTQEEGVDGVEHDDGALEQLLEAVADGHILPAEGRAEEASSLLGADGAGQGDADGLKPGGSNPCSPDGVLDGIHEGAGEEVARRAAAIKGACSASARMWPSPSTTPAATSEVLRSTPITYRPPEAACTLGIPP